VGITEPHAQNVESVLKQAYKLFSDYVVKNPFYIQDQPIKAPLFDARIAKEILFIDNLTKEKK
jgi:hypothetical protein